MATIDLVRNLPYAGWPARRPPAEPDWGGWFAPECARLMASLWRGGVAVELGSWLGQSTRWILDALAPPPEHVYAVDWWRGDHHICRDAALGAGAAANVFDRFLATNWEHRDRLTPVRTMIPDGVRDLAAAGVYPSLVFLDGCHEREAVRCDLLAALRAWPRVPVVGDDWWEHFPGVEQGVRDALATIGRPLAVRRDGRGWAVVEEPAE